ncbi:thioredoxin family protein [Flagellimonas sp.]|uniref:thioredoxin family protein n=1 Tax=Flagellimonas sp. TaxID=2058762 RepID=UPI003AB1F7CA
MGQHVHKLIQDGIRKGMDYAGYISMMNDLVDKGKATGTEQNEERIANTKLNAHRLRRIEKTMTVPEEKLEVFQKIPENQIWLVVLESWCSDGAQAVPLLHKIAKASSKIELRLVLKDENPRLMDYFLTNGTRSIPKLIVTNEVGEVLCEWGPRPRTASKMVTEYKKRNKKVDDRIKKELQMWYHRDGGNSMLDELIEIVKPH